eukprot:scaffold442_cov268-Pinguiococcus_pyrenoidosus.AAC.104
MTDCLMPGGSLLAVQGTEAAGARRLGDRALPVKERCLELGCGDVGVSLRRPKEDERRSKNVFTSTWSGAPRALESKSNPISPPQQELSVASMFQAANGGGDDRLIQECLRSLRRQDAAATNGSAPDGTMQLRAAAEKLGITEAPVRASYAKSDDASWPIRSVRSHNCTSAANDALQSSSSKLPFQAKATTTSHVEVGSLGRRKPDSRERQFFGIRPLEDPSY